ncbi:LacI family DNA-binding transcriptional regulator [Streptomyces sp. NPDC051677]|uniref:LacI family DNA-binding transcriptional regulator n=1 Tax=Streptomyces sp. NPDC051677 TaxID=3365669 RepID=UPI0037D4C5E6
MTGRSGTQGEGQYGLLTTIASEAGVSLSTVSKVVHRCPDVGAATRARVEELLARRGYVRPGSGGRAIRVFRRNATLGTGLGSHSPYTTHVGFC